MKGRTKLTGIAYALAAAVLFGASTPLAKRLLPTVEPMLLAGLLYLVASDSPRHVAGRATGKKGGFWWSSYGQFQVS